MRKYFGQIILSIVLAVSILFPILPKGNWYPMHDSTHVERVMLMTETIISGQFPPIWAYEINRGYGYPLFHFYAPLFHLTATLLFPFFLFPTSVIKLTLFLTLFVGILGIYRFARRWGRGAALLSAVAFTFAPYIALSIYVRGSYSELLSLSLIPWVLLATENIKSRKQVLLSSIALSLFVLSHNLIPLFILPLVAIWMVINNRNNLKSVIISIIFSILISSWFVLPLLFERSFTLADQVARTTNYSLHFVEPWQVWNSSWGFGGSAPGVEDGMSFKIGKLQIILGLLGLVFALIKKEKTTVLISGFAIFSLFLAIPLSKFLWDKLPLLQIVQFPWRALGPLTVFIILLAGSAYRKLPFRILWLFILIPALIIFGYKYFKPESITQSYLDTQEVELSSIRDISVVVPEYEPKWWVPEATQNIDGTLEIIIRDGTDIDDHDNEPQGRTKNGFFYKLFVPKDTIVSAGAPYYPTWKATIDGVEVPVFPDEIGFAGINIKEGYHIVEFYQSHTYLEQLSYALTIISIIGLIFWSRHENK